MQDAAPFVVGCFGPNDDKTLVTVAQCRAFYSGCGDGDATTIITRNRASPQEISTEYDPYCPCYDADGRNTGEIDELAVFGGTVGVYKAPGYVDGAGGGDSAADAGADGEEDTAGASTGKKNSCAGITPVAASVAAGALLSTFFL